MNETGVNTIVFDEIRALAEQHNLEKVILFGSRARGDFSRISDIDLAVQGGDRDSFALDAEEKTSTLLMFDIVNLDQCENRALREAINREGIVIYEKV